MGYLLQKFILFYFFLVLASMWGLELQAALWHGPEVSIPGWIGVFEGRSTVQFCIILLLR